ncbi:type III-A CRISPR-associated RAMP protein Csm5 [Atrimonas thermophila]|jgi:CRISPR-associated protein Csm5|uniref:type III-A CRISPR-associated RAMP protein Csm5 n=1 Tax=Atrimonas thermophila TaxID=3064161 RepID=UPI00399CA20C
MQLKVQTVTPVCVSSGETLSPVVDFVLDAKKNCLHMIDYEKLQRWLAESGDREALGELTRMALGQSGNIADFFESRKLDAANFARVSWSCSSAKELQGHSRNLKLSVLSVKGAFLPGSSVKGMLRTALMFHYLRDKGRAALDEILGNKNKTEKQAYTGENVFRKRSNADEGRQPGAEDDALRFLQVSDSDFCPLEKLRVYHLGRQGRGNRPIPLFAVAIPPGVEFNFQVRIDPNFEKADIPEYWKEFFKKERSLIEVLKEYTSTLIEREMQVLSMLGNSYQGLLGFYRKLANFNFPLFRLGFGKTYFFNSIGILLKNDEISHLIKDAKRFKNGKLVFPTTRWVIQDKDQKDRPLGWLAVKSVNYQ